MPDPTPAGTPPQHTADESRNGTPHPQGSDERPDRVVGPVSAATERFIATVEQLDDESLRAPSLCDGWTRAHVIAHVARNADALANLLSWAKTGVETPMYPSREVRSAEIEAGAAHAHAELVDDLRESAAKFSSLVSSMPEESWERQVRTGAAGASSAVPARRVMWLRLRELELHHTDLDAGYPPSVWPASFVHRALRESLQACGRRDEVPPFTVVINGTREVAGAAGDMVIRGGAAPILAWLTGRSSGDDLGVEPAGRLPELPPGAWL